jgi:hypothetical protein
MKLIAAVFFAMVLSYESSVDVGFCVKYEIEVALNSGQKVQGFVFVGGWEKKLTFDAKEFLEYHNAEGRRDTLEIYTNIRQLKFPVYEPTQSCPIRFDAATEKDMQNVPKTVISEIKVLRHLKCNECDDPEYHWSGMQAVITELSDKEISMMQQKPVAIISFTRGIDFFTEIFWIISYSSDHTQVQLEKIKHDYLEVTNKLINENKPHAAHYQKMKSTLQEKGVIVFRVDTAL